MGQIKGLRNIFFTVVLAYSVLSTDHLWADIVTDGTTGPLETLTGPAYLIPSSLGHQNGSNLFHSFETFNLISGESATFTGPDTITNIISRVTGNHSSLIDGSIISTINDANFYFLNPAGIIFGPSTSLNISGSFYASTANYLNMGEQGRFDASQPGNTILTSAPVQAFGFLGPAQDISARNCLLFNVENKSLSLIGGNLSIKSSIVYAPSGRVNLASVASAGEVTMDENHLSLEPGQQGGDITLYGSIITGSGTGNEQIYISGGNLFINNYSQIKSVSTDSLESGSVNIRLDDRLELTGVGTITSQTLGNKDGTNINIDAQEILMDGQGTLAGISTIVEDGATGNGGNISIVTSGLFKITNGARMELLTYGEGDCGNLFIDSGDITIEGNGLFSGVLAGTDLNATGHGGKIEIKTQDSLNILSAGQIIQSTTGQGNAGNVSINAGDIFIDGKGIFNTGIGSEVIETAQGNGGDISLITSGDLTLTNGGLISISTLGSGNAGSIRLTAGSIEINGQGNINSGIRATVGEMASGQGGDINISAIDTLSILNTAYIDLSTSGTGDAGNLTINSNKLLIDGQGNLTEVGAVVSPGAKGMGGDMDINTTGAIEIKNGGRINVSTYGNGDAGHLNISAESIRLTGDQKTAEIAAIVYLGATGKGGDIAINANGDLELINGGMINGSTYGQGNAGNIILNTDTILIDARHTAWTGVAAAVNTTATGNGGDITITNQDSMEIRDGGTITISTDGAGDAGTLDIFSDQLTVDGKGVYAGLSAYISEGATGNGGNINITTNSSLKILNNGYINITTSDQGNAGNANVKAADMLIDGQGNSAGFTAQVGPGAKGQGGDIVIEVDGRFQLLDGGLVTVSTLGQGEGGSLKVKAGKIIINSKGNKEGSGFSGEVNKGATGNGGDLSITVMDSMEIYNGGEISVSTFGLGDAGNLEVNAKDILIHNQDSQEFTGMAAQVAPNASGNGGKIILTTAESLKLINGGAVNVSTLGDGNGGSLNIISKNIIINGGGDTTGFGAEVGVDASGDAGNMIINVSDTLEIADGGTISSSTYSNGNAGNIQLTSGDIIIDGNGGFAGFLSDTYKGGTGKGGSIDITANENLELKNGGFISTSTSGQGHAGNLSVNAGDIFINGMENGAGFAAMVHEGAKGDGGDILINTKGSFELLNSGTLNISTDGEGNAGSLKMVADRFFMDNQASLNGTGISAESGINATGNGGIIDIVIDNEMEILNESYIIASAFGGGNAGNLNVNAGSILIDGKGNRAGFSGEVNPGAKGTGGDISVVTDGELKLFDGGVIIVSTFGDGHAGNLEVKADTIVMNNNGNIEGTGFAAEVSPEATGDGGDINITAAQGVVMEYGSKLTSSSYSTGVAGDITILSPNILLQGDSSISSEALIANGGNILINARDVLRLSNSQIATSVDGGKGDGGNITIDPIFLILDNSNIIANAHEGSGGNISLVSDYLFPDAFSIIEASSELGIDGTINIDTPNIDLSSNFATLPGYQKIPELNMDTCGSRTENNSSSLVNIGRGSLATDPGMPLAELTIHD